MKKNWNYWSNNASESLCYFVFFERVLLRRNIYYHWQPWAIQELSVSPELNGEGEHFQSWIYTAVPVSICLAAFLVFDHSEYRGRLLTPVSLCSVLSQACPDQQRICNWLLQKVWLWDHWDEEELLQEDRARRCARAAEKPQSPLSWPERRCAKERQLNKTPADTFLHLLVAK